MHKKLVIFGIVVLVLNIGLFTGGTLMHHSLVSERWQVGIGGFLSPLCGLIAAVALGGVVASFKTMDTTKAAWLAILAGLALNVCGMLGWWFFESVLRKEMAGGVSSSVDATLTLSYCSMLLGLGLHIRNFLQSGLDAGKAGAYVAIAAGLIALGAVEALLIYRPILAQTESSTIEKVVLIALPAFSLLVFTMCLVLAYITSLMGQGSFSKPWSYMAGGFLVWATADIIYAFLQQQGLYSSGNIIDIGWNLGYIGVALAATAQEDLLRSIG